jgi:hypothetical protein
LELSVRVYERKDNNNLRFKEKLNVFPVFADNIYFEPVNGDLYVAGPVDALHLETYKKDPLNEKQSGVVVKISNATSGK